LDSKTVLNAAHREMGGKMVSFSGWDMPLHYGSQLKEHLQVRESVGMFDVSHMTVVDICGSQASEFLRFVLANDIEKLSRPGKALYSLMLNEEGGVIDDLIVYFRSPASYRLVVNCATREKDLAWLEKQSAPFEVSIEEQKELSIIAVQGPEARGICAQVIDQVDLSKLASFEFLETDGWMIASTGYTGEEGFEVILPNQEAEKFWRGLNLKGVQPAGLGARDTLRLEAGYCLYGHEMDEQISPLSANLGWTLDFDDLKRTFIGREAIEAEINKGPASKLVGLILLDKGVLRQGQQVDSESGEQGVITSGSYSPSLEKSIALARVPMSVSSQCNVVVRNKILSAKVTKPAFVRQGKILA